MRSSIPTPTAIEHRGQGGSRWASKSLTCAWVQDRQVLGRGEAKRTIVPQAIEASGGCRGSRAQEWNAHTGGSAATTTCSCPRLVRNHASGRVTARTREKRSLSPKPRVAEIRPSRRDCCAFETECHHDRVALAQRPAEKGVVARWFTREYDGVSLDNKSSSSGAGEESGREQGASRRVRGQECRIANGMH